MKTKFAPYFEILRPAFLKVYIPVFLFLAVVLVLKVVGGIPFSQLTRDPISLAGLNPISGIVSNVGVLMWCVATTVNFFSAALLSKRDEQKTVNFLIVSGVLSFILMIDDFFVLHESLRDYFGIPENIIYVFYVMYLIFYFIKFNALILNKGIAMLLLAFGFLGGSATLDMFQKLIRYEIPAYFFVEDGLKLIGIASWMGYFVATSFTHIKSNFSAEMTTAIGDK